MGSYHLSPTSVTRLENYEYQSEDSLQKVLADSPETITSLPGLGLTESDICLSYREYPTSSGPMDLLIITKNAEIIIVETKLIRNAESTRTVVAQAIDYVKAFSNETVEDLMAKISKRESGRNTVSYEDKEDERFITLLSENIRKGNFRVVILGDHIRPNVLGMVESIQAAPHLAFTIYLVELNAVVYNGQDIIITPKIVANTVEIERSVIKIEVDLKRTAYKIESEAPSKEREGSKPTLSWEQYLDNVTNRSYANIIQKFKDAWVEEIDDSIHMGQVGFSAGIKDGGKRTAIQFVYDRKVALISEKWKENCNIPDALYQEYKEDIKKSSEVYDKYLVGNKVEIPFDLIDVRTLEIILDASLNLARKLKKV